MPNFFELNCENNVHIVQSTHLNSNKINKQPTYKWWIYSTLKTHSLNAQYVHIFWCNYKKKNYLNALLKC